MAFTVTTLSRIPDEEVQLELMGPRVAEAIEYLRPGSTARPASMKPLTSSACAKEPS